MSMVFRISLDGANRFGRDVVGDRARRGQVRQRNHELERHRPRQGMDWGPLLGQPSEVPSVLDDVMGVRIHNAARGANGGIVLDWPGGCDADDSPCPPCRRTARGP